MITTMKKYTFLVFHKEYDAFLEQLREAGVVHIRQKAEGRADDEYLQQQIELVKNLDKTIKDVNGYIPEGAVLVDADENTDANALQKEFYGLIAEKNQYIQAIAATKKEMERMTIWGNFDSDKLQKLAEAGYNLQFFSCGKSSYDPALEMLYNAVVVAEVSGTVYFVTVCKSNEEYAVPAHEIKLNEHNVSQLQSDIDGLVGLDVAQQAKLEAWAIANIKSLEACKYKAEQSIDWECVHLSTDSVAEDYLKVLEGYCPAENAQALNEILDAQCVYYAEEDPEEGDPTPIKLKNNWFVRLFEVLTGMYGWPNYKEFDPTPILGPFFLLFFALCIGDAGYGLILILVGYLLHKGKLKIEMFDGCGPIIMALGVGSAVVGYLMGGFFGIDLFAATWMPSWAKAIMFKGWIGKGGVVPIAAMGQDFDVMMILALVIGVFHICLAMVIKAIEFTKRFGFKENISSWGWIVLIVGGLATFILSSIGAFGPKVTSVILIVIAAISVLGIFIFNNPKRNPLINIGAGLWDTYGMVTGILGDVLSYIRLYALGLAGGMLGLAFNQLGTMVLGDTPNVGTWIGFIVIVTIGHVLNLLMACLGAFVHPLRLTFVEYFKNAGYEGTGKLYQPFKK